MPAEITKSKSKKKPFKVIVKGKNGEPLQSAQLFTTRQNCVKNLSAMINEFHGTHITVTDFTSIPIKRFNLCVPK